MVTCIKGTPCGSYFLGHFMNSMKFCVCAEKEQRKRKQFRLIAKGCSRDGMNSCIGVFDVLEVITHSEQYVCAPNYPEHIHNCASLWYCFQIRKIVILSGFYLGMFFHMRKRGCSYQHVFFALLPFPRPSASIMQ